MNFERMLNKVLKRYKIIFFVIVLVGAFISQFYAALGTFIVGFGIALLCAVFVAQRVLIDAQHSVEGEWVDSNKSIVRMKHNNATIEYDTRSSDFKWIDDRSFSFYLGYGVCVVKEGSERSDAQDNNQSDL